MSLQTKMKDASISHDELMDMLAEQMAYERVKKEITGHLMGGLGNLLFIVATCYALSKNNKSTLKFYTKIWNDKRKNITKYNMFKDEITKLFFVLFSIFIVSCIL